MSQIRRILHPSDFSGTSRAAFGLAVDMAKTHGAEMLVIHVIAPLAVIPPEGYVPPNLYVDLEARTRAGAEKELVALVARARKAGVKASSRLLEGPPADRIAEAARSWRASLIALGTHGRTGLARFFLGSVAARLVAIAPCPVLTVRGK
jgi:nucleotide-binding universal stress UspA family protein